MSATCVASVVLKSYWRSPEEVALKNHGGPVEGEKADMRRVLYMFNSSTNLFNHFIYCPFYCMATFHSIITVVLEFVTTDQSGTREVT